MDPFQIIMVLCTLFCSLVAGFLLAFTVVIMPGIGTLDDHGFLQAFKVIDRVIQDNQPVFMIVWAGSVLLMVAAGIMSFWWLEGTSRYLLIGAALVYFLGVQLPTATINVPLNNKLQAQELSSMSAAELRQARKDFEPRWVRWNAIRTWFAILVALTLMTVLGKVF